MHKCKYFKIQELVCPHVYKKYGDKAWEFFSEELLKDLDTVREVLGVTIIINNWHIEGQYKESGNRCPFCSIVAKKIANKELNMSMHNLYQAFDLKSKGLDIKKAVEMIMDNVHRFKVIKRIENPDHTPTWLHIDTKGHHKGIRIFNP
ncbi:MAG: hypothetical protein ACRDDH_03985 [Cetobacterium sp.]|uniref:hypothetical protein n=1 Tax=Cetobacterium sp. TaxID=2071632 RepID=UPI003EE5D115